MALRDKHTIEMNQTPAVVVHCSEMKPGDYAEIIDSPGANNTGRIIGRVWCSNAPRNSLYERFFALDNPGSTWSDPSFTVRILQPGETVTLTIGDEDE